VKLGRFCKSFKEKIEKEPQAYKNKDQPYICSILNECLSLLRSEKDYRNLLPSDEDEYKIQVFLIPLRLLLEIFYENVERDTLLEIFWKIEKELSKYTFVHTKRKPIYPLLETFNKVGGKLFGKKLPKYLSNYAKRRLYKKAELLDKALRNLYTISGRDVFSELILSGKSFNTGEGIVRITTCDNVEHYINAKSDLIDRMCDKPCKSEDIKGLFETYINEVVLRSQKYTNIEVNGEYAKIYNLFVTKHKEVEDFKSKSKDIESLLMHLGMDVNSEIPEKNWIFSITFNFKESDKNIAKFRTPTFFDAYNPNSQGGFSYFLSAKGSKRQAVGHWGKAFNLLHATSDNEPIEGLSEAVIQQIDCASIENPNEKCVLNEEGRVTKDSPDSKEDMLKVLIEKVLAEDKEVKWSIKV